MRLFLSCLMLALGLVGANAQDRRPSHCIALADATPGMEYVQLASFGAPLPDYTVRISYIDHSMFLIETPAGVTAATDFTGFIGMTELLPDVVTMNNSHSSHWTPYPDPGIPHALKGWAENDAPADHHLEIGDMLVRNVPTDARNGAGGVREDGNSIFVFEVEGLCIGHLGHLHHIPDAQQYAALGRLDVVMAPVDGGMTLDLPSMLEVVGRLRSSVIIPMHWFSGYSLELFLERIPEDFAIRRDGDTFMEVSLRTLPDRPTVVVLEPRLLADPED